MDKLTEHLPAIITAAAQSYLGILALLSVALSVLAYFFFAQASEKVKVGIFVLLFLGVAGFAAAMFRASEKTAGAGQTPPVTDTTQQSAAKPAATLSEEAKVVLKEAAADPAGLVYFERYGEGVDLHTNGKSLVTEKRHRVLAAWESALRELVDEGLMLELGDRGEVFEITKKGYDLAEHLPIQAQP